MSNAESDEPAANSISDRDVDDFMQIEGTRAKVDRYFEERFAKEPEAHEFATLSGTSMALLLAFKTSGEQGTSAPAYDVFFRVCTRLFFIFNNSDNDTLGISDFMHALDRARTYVMPEDSPHAIAGALDDLVIHWCFAFHWLERRQSPVVDCSATTRLWSAAKLADRMMLKYQRQRFS